MKTPEERIKIIKQSMSCFFIALWSFVPVIGLVPAVVTLVKSRRINQFVGDDWNPAGNYLVWSRRFAWFNVGLVFVTVVVGALTAALSVYLTV